MLDQLLVEVLIYRVRYWSELGSDRTRLQTRYNSRLYLRTIACLVFLLFLDPVCKARNIVRNYFIKASSDE